MIFNENRVADGTIGGRTIEGIYYGCGVPGKLPKSKRDWLTSHPAMEKVPRWMIIYMLAFYS